MLNGFLDKTCKKRSKAEKGNITIQYDIFEIVYVPNIGLNWQFGSFVSNEPKKSIPNH